MKSTQHDERCDRCSYVKWSPVPGRSPSFAVDGDVDVATCIMRISKRPKKTLSEIVRSTTVFTRSALVPLYHGTIGRNSGCASLLASSRPAASWASSDGAGGLASADPTTTHPSCCAPAPRGIKLHTSVRRSPSCCVGLNSAAGHAVEDRARELLVFAINGFRPRPNISFDPARRIAAGRGLPSLQSEPSPPSSVVTAEAVVRRATGSARSLSMLERLSRKKAEGRPLAKLSPAAASASRCRCLAARASSCSVHLALAATPTGVAARTSLMSRAPTARAAHRSVMQLVKYIVSAVSHTVMTGDSCGGGMGSDRCSKSTGLLSPAASVVFAGRCLPCGSPESIQAENSGYKAVGIGRSSEPHTVCLTRSLRESPHSGAAPPLPQKLWNVVHAIVIVAELRSSKEATCQTDIDGRNVTSPEFTAADEDGTAPRTC
mmetsp:Transcript_31177/g.92964  ORF Transcript_31177/g.92964 Transcript_31177/m.92964 type:complete len:433 (+) Transcript_31177:3942-5240(+)